MRRPASPSSAGTRVTAPAAAVTTPKTAASPSRPTNVMPEAYRPSMATATVPAASSTARPLVVVQNPAASTGSAPSMICCRNLVVRKTA